jgi:hypothetical protein
MIFAELPIFQRLVVGSRRGPQRLELISLDIPPELAMVSWKAVCGRMLG